MERDSKGAELENFNTIFLVELMVTLVVFGILAAVAVPLYQTNSPRTRRAQPLLFADAALTRTEFALQQGCTPDPAALNTRANLISRIQRKY